MNNALCGPQSTEHYPQVSSEEISRPNNERWDGIRHNVGRVAGTSAGEPGVTPTDPADPGKRGDGGSGEGFR